MMATFHNQGMMDMIYNMPYQKQNKNTDFQKLQVPTMERTMDRQSTYGPSVDSVNGPVNFQFSSMNDS